MGRVLLLAFLFLSLLCTKFVEATPCDEWDVLATVCEAGCDCSAVIDLDLSFQSLFSLPSQISALTNLEELYIGNNLLSSLPNEIGSLQNLRILDLSVNKLGFLPNEFGNLQNLVELYLYENQLTSLPDSFSNLINLKSCDMYGNLLTSLPSSIGKLSNLDTFFIYQNQLTSLPPGIALLTQLKDLVVYENQLTTLPSEIGNGKFETIEIQSNQITKLPTEIGNLSTLKTLFMYDNLLKRIPTEIGLLTNLEILDFSDNDVIEIPTELSQLNLLTSLFIENPVTCPVTNPVSGNLIYDTRVSSLQSDCENVCFFDTCPLELECFLDGENYNIAGCRTPYVEYVACPSGFVGNPCTPVDNSCDFTTIQPLVTTPIAELLVSSSSLTNNDLVIVVSSEATVDRVIEEISLGTNTIPMCVYPGPKFVKQFNPELCTDVFVGILSFQEAIACGFSPSLSNSSHFIYDAYIKVVGTDQVGKLREIELTRTTTSIMSVMLVLSKTISVEVNLTSFSEISTHAAVVAQSYDPVLRRVSFSIVTSVQYPYEVVSFSPFSVGLETLICDPNSPCEQKALFEVDLLPDACTFSGDYSIFYFYGCREGSCDGNGTIDFTLQSGDLCSKLVVNSLITGSLESYESDTFSIPSLVFAANQVAYFKATVNAQVTLESLQLRKLVVKYEAESKVLVLDGNIELLGNQTNLLTFSALNDYYFSFELSFGDGLLFNPTNEDAIISFTVEADFDINYRTTFGRKRDFMTEAFSIKKQLIFNYANELSKVGTSHSNTQSPKALFLVFLFVVLFFTI